MYKPQINLRPCYKDAENPAQFSTEESPDGQAEDSLKKTEVEKCVDTPLPLENQDADSKPSEVYMESQIEDKPEESEMLSQPCTQTEEMEMDNSQVQSEGNPYT
ncbi:hypothetical protein scyTo_0001600 [Scyliorhinus torazame]|uniref:Uncharacterized protein n=1 Tax=Scyliorhinus torazame TaxID=75743 RepID=A0A401PEI2_SCYTO|nr:hypothetical protein [Scyliorhinus torazame]